jgi:hypothetical protein
MLLYLLYLCYDTITFVKPNTSRLSNSEKYVVCKHLTIEKAKPIIHLMKQYFSDKDNLCVFIPRSFIKNIIEYNRAYTCSQINSINKIINMIQTKKEINETHRKKVAIDWCLQYKLPFKNKYTR